MAKEKELLEVTQKVLLARKNKILIALDEAAGKWDLPGGRIDKNETDANASFAREVLEELGLQSFKQLSIVGREILVNRRGVPTCAIGILINNDSDKLIISKEHLEFKWIIEDEINNYDFIYPQIVALVVATFKYLNQHKRNEK